jgi:SNF2 family DNA or RNA helicase
LQANFSEIYFVSPHWNPCVEDQAVARCHRIGQTKPTYVFKFAMGMQSNSLRQRQEEEEEEADNLKPQSLETYVNQVQTLKRNVISEIIRQ